MEIQGLSREERLENLFIAARNARETGDEKTAIKHYEDISAIAPNSWEALFYLAVLKTNTIKYGEISNAAVGVCNCLPKVFELINTTIEDEKEKKDAVAEVQEQCGNTAAWLIRASGNYYNSLTRNDVSFSILVAAARMDAKRHARYESAQRAVKIADVLLVCGNCIEATFGLNDAFYQDLAIDCWEAALQVHVGHVQNYKVAVYDEEKVKRISAKIQKYDSSYETPTVKATEKRDYTVAAIALMVVAFVVVFLWYWWIWM